MRRLLNYLLLLLLKGISVLFYRLELNWLSEPLEPSWSEVRVVAMLNHTSLFEWLWAAVAPNAFLWRIATHGMVPVADKTIRRPIIGRFFNLLAPHMVSITRESDHTWRAFLERIEDSLVIILPEGRMKRADGLDAHGQPMTVRGGIADILQAIPDGKMLILYSGGLHHVQVPGQRMPRLFKTIRTNLEAVDIAAYREALMDSERARAFKRAVKVDLERRRDLNCPPAEEPAGKPAH